MTGGLSQESVWEYVSSGLQDSYEYFSQSKQCSLNYSSDFQFFHFFSISLGANYNRYCHHPHGPQFFLVLWLNPNIWIFFHFLPVLLNTVKLKATRWQVFFPGSGLLTEVRWSVRISKSHRILCISFSWRDFGLYRYHLVV